MRQSCLKPSIKHRSGDKRRYKKNQKIDDDYAIYSNLEPIDEKKVILEEGQYSIDKDDRNPACEEVIIIKDRGG